MNTQMPPQKPQSFMSSMKEAASKWKCLSIENVQVIAHGFRIDPSNLKPTRKRVPNLEKCY